MAPVVRLTNICHKIKCLIIQILRFMSQNQNQVPLSDLQPGDAAVVLGLKASGAIKQRLLEMGFTRGAHIKIEKYAPMGDPMELVIKGYHLSLRKEECQSILVAKEAPWS